MIKAKDLATLGALSGPDLGLMQQLLTDPTPSVGEELGKERLLSQIDQALELLAGAQRKERAMGGGATTNKPGGRKPTGSFNTSERALRAASGNPVDEFRAALRK